MEELLADARSATTLQRLLRPATIVPAGATCATVEAVFSRDVRLTVVVVVDDVTGACGLVSRGEFSAAMCGPHGFGRALHSGRPVRGFTDWGPLRLPPQTTVERASRAALARPERRRYQEILTWQADGGHAVVDAAAVLQGLAAEYEHRALHDTLTRLPNRELFLRRLEALCTAGSRQASGRVAVGYIDLDRFKAVNDTLGHGAGDVVLQAVAERLRTAVRPEDLVARLGGDEFAVLLDLPSEPPVGSVDQLARRMVAVLAPPVPCGDRSLLLSASIGMSVSVAGGPHAASLLRTADEAMYAAKRGGGSYRIVEEVGRSAGGAASMAVDDSLRRALHAGEFRLHYQPIVALADGRPASVEALVRWQHPERGLLAPGHFLAAAEANGTVVDLGGWVLQEACRQLATWDDDPAVSAPASVNVNVSVRQLLSGKLRAQVEQALAVSGLAPGRLRLELPETATVQALEPAAPLLMQLRARGVRLTLDDVGAGANSLRHLTSFEVDGIKIDRSFVATMLSDRRDMAVVRMLVELADALGVHVTAEGVEEQEQREALVELGCGYGQGYLFARPCPAAEVQLSPLAAAGPPRPRRG